MIRCRRSAGVVVLLFLVGCIWIPNSFSGRGPDIYWVPTPDEVVVKMLQVAKITANDVVYDLGCGDGRIVITAAKVFGARGIGIDIDPQRIRESTENALRAGVSDRVTFIQADLFETDIKEATVVTLYLLTELNVKLRPKLLRDLKPGTRILSHEFDMGDWKPDASGVMRNMKLFYSPTPVEKDVNYYFWVVPANVAGLWAGTLPAENEERDFRINLTQTYQQVEGTVMVKEQEFPITNVRLAGDQLRFTFRDKGEIMRLNARVNGDTMTGSVEIRGQSTSGTYSWMAQRRKN